MFEINVLKNDILPFSANSSSNKEVKETDVDLDFHSILQSIKEGKSVSRKHNEETNEHKTSIEIDEEIDKDEGIIDKISYLLGLLIEAKSSYEQNYKELEIVDINDVLMELEESFQLIEDIHNSNEPIHFSTEEIELLVDVIGQAKEIVSEENIKDYPFMMEIENAMEEVEEKLINILDLTDNRKGDIEKGEIIAFKEDNAIKESNDIKFDHGLEEEDIGLEEVKNVEYSKMESNIDLNDDSLMEDGKPQTTTDLNYTFNLFTKDIAATDNTTDANFTQDINREDLVQQIVEKVVVEKVEIKEGIDKQEVKIRLKPDYLGELILKVEAKEGSIQAKIFVDNYQTKEIIELSLFQLKEQLEENNLDIKTFEVFVGTNEDFEREKRNGHTFRKKQEKLKLGTKVEEEIRIYDSNFVKQSEETYYEGRLNLFA